MAIGKALATMVGKKTMPATAAATAAPPVKPRGLAGIANKAGWAKPPAPMGRKGYSASNKVKRAKTVNRNPQQGSKGSMTVGQAYDKKYGRGKRM